MPVPSRHSWRHLLDIWEPANFWRAFCMPKRNGPQRSDRERASERPFIGIDCEAKRALAKYILANLRPSHTPLRFY